MNTRIEIINKNKYCAYCGKLLSKYTDDMVLLTHTSSSYDYRPIPDIKCDCEKAKLEISLCEQIKELYNSPIADNLIEMKVNDYRNKLLHKGDYESSQYITLTGAVPSITCEPLPYEPYEASVLGTTHENLL